MWQKFDIEESKISCQNRAELNDKILSLTSNLQEKRLNGNLDQIRRARQKFEKYHKQRLLNIKIKLLNIIEIISICLEFEMTKQKMQKRSELKELFVKIESNLENLKSKLNDQQQHLIQYAQEQCIKNMKSKSIKSKLMLFDKVMFMELLDSVKDVDFVSSEINKSLSFTSLR